MWLVILLVFIFANSYGIITEVFTGNGKFFDREEKYIEIYNNGSESIPISAIELRIYTNENTYIKLGVKASSINIELPDVLRNVSELKPQDVAIIISTRYTNHLELLPFASNCIILSPSSETLWNSSWHSRISNIELWINGVKYFETGQINLKEEEGKSFQFDGKKFISEFLSCGVEKLEYISTSNLIVTEGDIIEIYGKNSVNKLRIYSTKTFYNEEREISSYFNLRLKIPKLRNGENLILEAGKTRLVLRYVDFNELSDYYGKVFINELVGDPKKDYSGGNWTGEDGRGTINSTDDWIELVNFSFESLNIKELFFLEKGINLKKLIPRNNPTSADKNILENGFVIVTPEGGLSQNSDLYLFIGNPFKGGKIIDYIDYKEISLKANSLEDEALSCMIQGEAGLDKKKSYKKTKVTFLKENSPPEGFLTFFLKEDKILLYVSDNSIEKEYINVKLKNYFDEEEILLKKTNFYFKGEIKIVENSKNFDGLLTTGKGCKTEISYINPFTGREVKDVFSFVKDGWNLPENTDELTDFIIYPNPFVLGRDKKLKITKFPVDSEIFLLDDSGNIIKNEKLNGSLIEWEENLKRGFYLVVIHHKGKRVIKKLFVY